MTQHRVLNVDALRGFALLGILAVNIWPFSDPYFGTLISNPAHGALDDAVRFVFALLFESKFYLLFSFLFGYSFVLQMGGAEHASADFKVRIMRRAAGLLMLGVLHGCLLFQGDILTLYGLLGVLLLMWSHLSPERAIKRARLLVILTVLLMLALALVMFLDSAREAETKEILAKLAAFHGSARETQSAIMSEFMVAFPAILVVQGPTAMAMMLLGLVAGRMRLFARVDEFGHWIGRAQRLGFTVGLAGAVAYAGLSAFWPEGAAPVFGLAISFATAPFLTAAYVATLLKFFDTTRGRRLRAALAPMGKIALTNYLTHSLVLAFVFSGYGLGLMDRLPVLAVALLVFLVFGSQMPLSAWWVKRFDYGPAEWLLRAITYWSIPRRQVAGVQPPSR
jgi:uncharacterized protein